MNNFVFSSVEVSSLLWVALLLVFDFFSVMFATVVDLVSGLRKARRNGARTTSRGYRRTIDKLLRYFLTLIALTAVDALLILSMLSLRVTMGWSLPVFPLFATIGALAMTLIEVKSVMENSHHKTDLTSAVGSATDLLADPSIVRLLETIRSLRSHLGD